MHPTNNDNPIAEFLQLYPPYFTFIHLLHTPSYNYRKCILQTTRRLLQNKKNKQKTIVAKHYCSPYF